MLLSLSSCATAGKDTFYTLLRTHLTNRTVTRMAFADQLRRELDPLFAAFGGTAFETDPVKKAAMRPLLVSYGMSKRIVSGGRYWIEAIEPDVKKALAAGDIVVITDCRFPNELDWVKSLGGKCVYIERTRPDGTLVPPVNSDEAEHDSAMRAGANVTVSWDTRASIHDLWPFGPRPVWV